MDVLIVKTTMVYSSGLQSVFREIYENTKKIILYLEKKNVTLY